MNELTDPRTLEALRRDRQAPAPDGAQARVASRLGMTDPGSSDPPRPVRRIRAEWPTATKAGVLAFTFFAGAAAGALLRGELTRTPAPRETSVHAPVRSNPGAGGPELAGTTGARRALSTARSSEDLTPAPPEAPAPPMAAGSPRQPPGAGRYQLDAERKLLDRARAALVSGETDAALRTLDEHAKTYPRALLGEEHDALVVQALVQAGRYEEARARADAFRRNTPDSLLLPAVESAITSAR